MKLLKATKDLWAKLDGKKTYIIAVIAAVVGLVQAFGVQIPEIVWVFLTAAGLGTLRASVPKK